MRERTDGSTHFPFTIESALKDDLYNSNILFYSGLKKLGYPVIVVPLGAAASEDELNKLAAGIFETRGDPWDDDSLADEREYLQDAQMLLINTSTPEVAKKLVRMWDVFQGTPIGKISYLIWQGPDTHVQDDVEGEAVDDQVVTSELAKRGFMTSWEQWSSRRRAFALTAHLIGAEGGIEAIEEYRMNDNAYLDALSDGLTPLTPEELSALIIEQLRLLQESHPDFKLNLAPEED